MLTQAIHPANHAGSHSYANCLANARKVNWDIDRDVIRFRTLDRAHKFLPDSLTKANEVPFLSSAEQLLMSQVQGRTYACMFGLIERYINAKVLQLCQHHALGSQVALAALIQFSQEELKHQELFERIDALCAAVLPAGYEMSADANAVAQAVLSKSTWAVLALTCHIEIFTLAHYKHSIRDTHNLSPLFKDVFRFHWMEEAQHATLDELEWQRVHDSASAIEIERGVDDLIALVHAVDGILQVQAQVDARYFTGNCVREFSTQQQRDIEHCILKAYRWQYIVSGVLIERFQKQLSCKLTAQQLERIHLALAPLLAFVES